MHKRSSERVPSSLLVKFVHSDSMCYGIITNVSEKGMCIKSGVCLPCNSTANLLIPMKDEHLEVAAEVKWVKETNDFYDAMGVELSSPPDRYFQVLENIKSLSNIATTTL